MQALILAAGMGRRLGHVTEDKTKGMVEVNGKTLLERSLDILTSFDEISRIIIVVGYAKDGVIDAIGDSYSGKEVIYVENKDYYKTNNIYSLYLAENIFKEDDTILLESDLIFERSLIEQLISDKTNKDLVLVAPWENWMDGTVVTLSDDRGITQFIGKENFDYGKTESYYKTVNIYKFSKDFISRIYIPFMEAYTTAFGLNEYYENILGVLTFINKTSLKASVLEKGEKWYEIDDINDLDIAETLFSGESSKYLHRYGGFWRFSQLRDFCYLVNPYFPTQKMVDEFKMSFKDLLSEYPSTARIQCKLAANMFNCDIENIIVGNGASELINALLSVLEYERVGIPLPTFHEYIARLDPDKTHFFQPENDNFSYNADDLINFSENVDTLIVINPDNPTGNLIPKDDLLKLLDHLKENKKQMVIDESFVDFADSERDHSLIYDDILQKYPNLIVIKSVGKSYGVPGCRLGVMATADHDIRDLVLKTLPIWNISSFGEFFLQIFHRYRKDYESSIVNIVKQREILFDSLSNFDYLRPVPSSANYILCEVLEPVKCSKLTQSAIDWGFLIKDCSDKLGFDSRQFIRVTVRDEKDNADFVEFLKTFKK